MTETLERGEQAARLDGGPPKGVGGRSDNGNTRRRPTVSTEAEELHRIISTSVRDMLDAFRIQAQGAGDRQGP